MAGVADRVTLTAAAADAFPDDNCDHVACFDGPHDMGDPVTAARDVHEAPAPDGQWLVIEPRAGDRVENNLSHVARPTRR